MSCQVLFHDQPGEGRQTHALLALKGDTLLTVQGLFLNLTSTAGPTGFTDVKDQLVALAKLGLKKV